jgi:hypothetical protein
MIHYTKSLRFRGITFVSSSLFCGVIAWIILPRIAATEDFNYLLTIAIFSIGIVFSLIAFPLINKGPLKFHADDNHIQLDSPHPAYGGRWSIQLADVKSILIKDDDEGVANHYVLLNDGTELLLPKIKGFPHTELQVLIQNTRSTHTKLNENKSHHETTGSDGVCDGLS